VVQVIVDQVHVAQVIFHEDMDAGLPVNEFAAVKGTAIAVPRLLDGYVDVGASATKHSNVFENDVHLVAYPGFLIRVERIPKEADLTLQFDPAIKASSREQWKPVNDAFRAEREMTDTPDLASSQGSTASHSQSSSSSGMESNASGSSSSSTRDSTPTRCTPSNQPLQLADFQMSRVLG
jgi:hypothetical protein